MAQRIRNPTTSVPFLYMLFSTYSAMKQLDFTNQTSNENKSTQPEGNVLTFDD